MAVVGVTNFKTLALFKLKSLLLPSLLVILFLSFSLIGCGGGEEGSSDTDGGGNGGSGNNKCVSSPSNPCVSFYDKDLNLIGSIPLEYSISSISSGLWFKAGATLALTSHNGINGDIRLYAIPNVQEITNQSELNTVRNNLKGNYVLINDIELDKNDAIGFDNNGWIPIGSYSSTFTGIFNGNSHKITNIWLDRPSETYQGFFGRIKKGKIKNLVIEIAAGKQMSGNYYVGGIAGSAGDNSEIINSYVVGNISGVIRDTNNGYIGGIAGGVSSSKIINSYVDVNVSGARSVGGIAGSIGSGSEIIGSYAKVNAIGYYGSVGGIAGSIGKSKITGSHANVNVVSYHFGDAGGITGYAGDGSNVTNNRVNGNVYGNGGLFFSSGGIVGSLISSEVINSSIVGNVTNKNLHAGGIAGGSSGSKITNSYIVGNVNGSTHVGGIAGDIIDSYIANNYVFGNVNGEVRTGGIVGDAVQYPLGKCEVTNNYIIGNVNGGSGSYAGGIAGYINYANITNNYIYGDVKGDSSVGGVVGYALVNNHALLPKNNVAINNYVTGNQYVNRAIGFISTTYNSNDRPYNFVSITVGNKGNRDSNFTNENETIYHGIGKTPLNFQLKNTYQDLGWLFGDSDTAPWKIDKDKNGGYPTLYWQK